MLMCILGVAGIVNAQQQVGETEARNAAINTLRNKTDVLKVSSDDRIKTVNSLSNTNRDTLMYEVVFQNGVAVLLSGSKTCLPVLGFYTKEDNGSVFDPNNDNVPCGLKALLKGYADDIEWGFAQDTICLYHKEKWQELQQSSLHKSSAPPFVHVAPLLTTEWGQWHSNDAGVVNGAVVGGDCPAYNYYVKEPLNSQCSKENCGNRCPIGCTGVAMGQIMKYWNYPVYLPNKVQQYDWCNMQDKLLSYRPNYTQERHIIAQLLKDCADAANADYCIANCATSATAIAARSALINDFYYNSNAVFRLRSSHPINLNNVWIDYLRTNLNAGRPVLYGALGIHAHYWVCDGYGDDGNGNSHEHVYFHFNFGHTGSNDGWYTVDNITADPHWNSLQEAVFDIYPDLNQDYCNFTLPLYLHYFTWNYGYGMPIPFVHMIVPQTATRLWSVPESNSVPTSWHTIASGEAAIYTAHEEVRLLPGFHAAAGSVFIARIEPCTSCDSKSRSTLLFAQSENTSEIYEFNNSNDTTVLSSNSNLQKERQSNDITLHPNPNNGTFTIQTNIDPQEIVSIRVLTPLGLVLYEQEGLPSRTIQLPSSAKGVYFVEINTTAQRVIRKMVVY